MQRVLICGDRNWADQALIDSTLMDLHTNGGVECVIEGEARGADSMGRLAAMALGIPVLRFPAQWGRYGRGAGPIRNQQMLDEGRPTLVLAFHNDLAHSKGTADMVRRAQAKGVKVRVLP